MSSQPVFTPTKKSQALRLSGHHHTFHKPALRKVRVGIATVLVPYAVDTLVIDHRRLERNRYAPWGRGDLGGRGV